ncbi:MAG: GAF domain-containing protein, partial [Candidatus Dormibacteraceae bacterium]
MARHIENPTPGLPALLSELTHQFQRASGADMVSLTLLDAATRTYYAPFVVGQPEEGLAAALADQSEQLRRYDTDRQQGKVPDEIHVRQYGSSVWLAVTRRPLVAANAPAEVDSTFVRRHRVASLVGLPLFVRHRYLGHVYLNYCAPGQPAPPDPRLPEGKALKELEALATDASHQILDGLAFDERTALDGVRRLAQLLATPAADDEGDGPALRRRFSIALSELLIATDQAAAAIYQLAQQRGSLELVSAQAPIAVPMQIPVPEGADDVAAVTLDALRGAAQGSGLEAVAARRLTAADRDPDGYLVILSRDPLAPLRWSPATDVLLSATADLITGALASQELIGDLEQGNRLLGALSKMTTKILRPGASRQQVLEAVAQRLTDASAPEFDFDFATVALIGAGPDGGLAVRAAAGASTVETIHSQAVTDGASGSRGTRVPVWALPQERALMPDDVLAYSATHWETVVVGPEQRNGEDTSADFLEGYAPQQVRLLRVPVQRKDGEVLQYIPIAIVGEAFAGAPTDAPPPFTLDADIFEANRHGDLIRIFLPFGLDPRQRATGVLEVGYQVRTEKIPSRTQVEALRAAASQIAVAVDTARLYEEAQRHAEQLEVSSDISKAIASSIDLDQTLLLVARNLVRLVDATFCQIALYDEDTSGWYGAADSTGDRRWSRLRGERAPSSFLFEALERGEPNVIEDATLSELVPAPYKEAFRPQSMMVVPMVAGDEPIGAAILVQQDPRRRFRPDEIQLAQNLGHQAAIAIKNARLHALAEEENHIQKDFLLLGFGMWGQKAYQHLQTLKQFFNFRIHVVERAETRERLADKEKEVLEAGDLLYWDSDDNPAHEQLQQALETSCYVITYIATPAATHLPTLARYYALSDVVVIEKPLGAPPDAYRAFLDSVPGGVELIAADHYYFKL